MKKLGMTYIFGGGYEAVNSAILLASLELPVTVVCAQARIDATLHHYKFDRQMVLLWRLYISEAKIIHRADDKSDWQADTFWLFSDELDDDFYHDFIGGQHSECSHVIISGQGAIGQVASLAMACCTPHVFYLPFVFMKDGSGVGSLFAPDLVLIGQKTDGGYLSSPILSFFVHQARQYHLTDIKTAEFARASIMAMLATRLSFMNELARLADSEQVNIKEVETIMGKDVRIGNSYLSAGWGFGGKSLPSELDLLAKKFATNHVSSQLIHAVMSINEDQKELIFRKFWRYFDGFIEHKSVVIWGAGYRSGTGLTTNSAIHPLLALLWSYDIRTTIYGHNTLRELHELYDGNELLCFSDDPYTPLMDADALFILNWSPIIAPDIDKLSRSALPIFDAKNVLSDTDVAAYAGVYFGIGREKA